MDEFSENLRAAFAPTPPLPFGKKKIITKFFENFSIMEKTGVPYSGTDEGLLFNRKGKNSEPQSTININNNLT